MKYLRDIQGIYLGSHPVEVEAEVIQGGDIRLTYTTNVGTTIRLERAEYHGHISLVFDEDWDTSLYVDDVKAIFDDAVALLAEHYPWSVDVAAKAEEAK